MCIGWYVKWQPRSQGFSLGEGGKSPGNEVGKMVQAGAVGVASMGVVNARFWLSCWRVKKM